MAAPSFVQASTGTTDATGAWTHTSAAPAAGNVLLVQVLQDGTAADVAIDSVTNAENLAGTDNTLTKIGEFDVGSAVAASQHLWIGRALSTSAMVITGSNAGGDDVYVRVYEFRNVSTGTTLDTVIENATAGSTVNSAGTSDTASDASVTTLGVDRLALNLVAVNDDNLISEFTGATGGWWRLDANYASSSGTDGAIALMTAYPGIAAYHGGNQGVDSINGGTGTAEMNGMAFTSGAGGTVASVIANITKDNSPVDDVVVEIWSESGGQPSAVVGTGGQISGASLSASAGAFPSFTVSATLSASTTYYIVTSRTGARDTTNRYSTFGRNPGTYSSGENHTRSSGTWTTTGTGDMSFSVQLATGSTIDGGTGSIVDSDAWGVVGFALIGTTAAGPAASLLYDPRALQYLRVR